MSAPQSADLLMHLLRRWWGTISTRDSQAFSLDWVNDYIQQVWYSSWVVSKLNDGTRDYRQCYGGYFNIWDSNIHGLDNRSVQTMKFVFQLDDLINWINLSAYNWSLSVKINTSGQIEVEWQWTWSIRVASVGTFTAWSVVNVVVRINNVLPSWTARVVWDIDIFIGWVKDAKTSAGLWTSTTTTSTLLWWAYNATTNIFRWRLYSFSLRNRALSDAECQAEWLSNWAVVTPSWLVNTRDTTNTSQAISRTWYNLNVSGNVTTGTDTDWKYMSLLWSVWSMVSWSALAFSSISLSHSIKIRIKTWSSVWWIQRIYNNVISASNRVSITINAWELMAWIYNWTTYVWKKSKVVSPNTLYDVHYVRDAVSSTWKIYFASVEETNVPAWQPSATWTAWFYLWWPSADFFTWYIYHTRVRARALTQAEINADIALWNNTNNDPTIVASYRPDNLINAQFLSNTSDFTNAAWAKTNTTVTWDFSTAPDGTTTADMLTITWALHNWVSQTSTTLTGSSLASKTIISKVFMKVASWTWTARIRLDHAWVDSNQYSWDLTVTTTWQEFTFTRTLTSATGWAWITTWITTWTAWAALTVEVWNMRTFLVNEILYDNSPNIGGYVWPLTNRYISWWIKPWVDAPDDSSGNPIMNLWYGFAYIRTSSNFIRIRYDNRIWAIERFTALWTWFRNWVHFTWWIEWDWSQFYTVVYLNGVLIWRGTISYLDAWILLNPNQTNIWAWRNSSRYYTGNLRDLRFYTSPTALTDAQALMIVNGWEPSGASKVLHRNTNSISWNYVLDQSWNGRVWLMTGGITLVRK